MKTVSFFLSILAFLGVTTLSLNALAASEFVVYSVNQGLNMGNVDEVTPKDVYVNMGAKHGLQKGAKLDVIRPLATYDLINKKLFGDMSVPVAILKVIHVDEIAAVARIEKMLPIDETPNTGSSSVMIGDIVRISHK